MTSDRSGRLIAVPRERRRFVRVESVGNENLNVGMGRKIVTRRDRLRLAGLRDE